MNRPPVSGVYAGCTGAVCAPPTHSAFDIDIYDCPCGHMYGDHDYRWTGGNDHGNVMDIAKCCACESAAGAVR